MSRSDNAPIVATPPRIVVHEVNSDAMTLLAGPSWCAVWPPAIVVDEASDVVFPRNRAGDQGMSYITGQVWSVNGGMDM
ncbi:hypothetical protein Mycsm_02637 [Mycobacterium sp. JS623]|uniref:hypothetical protein n=1 Tax=Mycobacterium sp. JS623 TaxID=212767 RepID=UPI0002A5B470|nr:hypothetical protein [Mycobacterium sp. JS623]AGB22971.1 hypothetical protein Mycsm_02637 [Mycobacterium sp. JS623]